MQLVKLNKEGGFTLVELLVSMSILAVVITVVVEAFWLGQRSWERGSEVVEVEQRQRTAIDVISKQLSSAFPVEVNKKESDSAFTGTREEIFFVTTLPMGFERRPGLFYVGYYLEEAGGGGLNTLKVLQRPYYTGDPPDIGDRDNGFTVLAGLEEVIWGYFSDGEWTSQFKGEYGSLPERVRLTLVLSNGENPESPESRETVIVIVAEPNRAPKLQMSGGIYEHIRS